MPRAALSVTISDRVRVGEQVALLQRVGGVLLPAVLGVHRGEGGVDAAGRERGVRVGAGPLAEGKDVDTLPRRARSRRAGHDPPVPITRTEVEICCSVIPIWLSSRLRVYSPVRTDHGCVL